MKHSKKIIPLLLFSIITLSAFSQDITDFYSDRSTNYSSLAYQVAKAICPITATGYHCIRITNFSYNSDGTRRAYFYFRFRGQVSVFAEVTTFDLLLDLDIDNDGRLNYIHGGYEDSECKNALSLRRSIGEETYWGKKIYDQTVDTDYETVRQKAKYSYQ